MSVSADRARPGTIFSELGFARPFAIGVVMVVALAIQSTLLTRATILGVTPQLLFTAVVCLAFLEGETVGVVVGFSAGLFQDFLQPESIVGLTALVYTMVGYGVGSIRYYTSTDAVWTPVLTVAIASGLAEGGYALMAIMMGERWVSVADTTEIVGLVVLYNTLLTPFVFPLIRRVADRVRPERVIRL
jgi:rod shape-determining protein MreD